MIAHDLLGTAIAPPSAPRGLVEYSRTIRLPDGPMAGSLYDPRSHPAQYEFLKAYESGNFQNFCVVGPTQDGKSWCVIIIPLCWELFELEYPVVIGLPDENLASATWAGKIRPAIRKAGLGHLLPTEGLGSKGGSRVTMMVMANGVPMIFIGGGGKSESPQAGRTAPVTKVDEVDSFRDRPHLLPLIDRRADAYQQRARRTRTTTIKSDRHSLILKQLADSTDSRTFVYHGCDHWFHMTHETLHYDPESDRTARQSAVLACPRCGQIFADEERLKMLRDYRLVHRGQSVNAHGEVIGEEPDSETFGLLWNAFDSPLRSLGELAVLHRRAAKVRDETGWHHDMRQVYRDQFVVPYLDAEDSLDLSEDRMRVKADTSQYRRGSVPGWCKIITLTVDVQLRRHYWLICGHDDRGRTAIIDWGTDRLCEMDEMPDESMRHKSLDKLHDRLVKKYRVNRAGIDVGFYSSEIRSWVRRHKPLWISLRGAGTELVHRMKTARTGKMVKRVEGFIEIRDDMEQVDRRTAWVDADSVLDGIALAWAREADADASILLPVDVDDFLVRHLAGMRPSEKDSGPRWIEKSKRHDLLDCLVYGRSIAKLGASKSSTRPLSEIMR